MTCSLECCYTSAYHGVPSGCKEGACSKSFWALLLESSHVTWEDAVSLVWTCISTHKDVMAAIERDEVVVTYS